MSTLHFNPVTNCRFSGRNEVALQEAAAENGYKSRRWITYWQAGELGLIFIPAQNDAKASATKEQSDQAAKLRGKAVGMIRFDSKTKKPVWYNVFNVEVFDNFPAKLLKGKAPAKTKKAAKAAPKKAAKAAPKKAAAKAAPESVGVAIPVQGMENTFIIQQPNGTFQQVTL